MCHSLPALPQEIRDSNYLAVERNAQTDITPLPLNFLNSLFLGKQTIWDSVLLIREGLGRGFEGQSLDCVVAVVVGV